MFIPMAGWWSDFDHNQNGDISVKVHVQAGRSSSTVSQQMDGKNGVASASRSFSMSDEANWSRCVYTYCPATLLVLKLDPM